MCLIRISRYYEGSKVNKINDKGILTLLDSVPNLKTANVFQITDEALAKIITSCKSLVKICLSGCLEISGNDFAILG